MHKTTIYLPDGLRLAVRRSARRRSISEAEVIRQAIAAAVEADDEKPARRARGALFSSGGSIARDVDQYLSGFGDWRVGNDRR